MEKDTSNPFHHMNVSQVEIHNTFFNNSPSIIENGHEFHPQFCNRGNNVVLIVTYTILNVISKNKKLLNNIRIHYNLLY